MRGFEHKAGRANSTQQQGTPPPTSSVISHHHATMIGAQRPLQEYRFVPPAPAAPSSSRPATYAAVVPNPIQAARNGPLQEPRLGARFDGHSNNAPSPIARPQVAGDGRIA